MTKNVSGGAQLKSAPLHHNLGSISSNVFCVSFFQNNLTDYYHSELMFHTRFLSHFTLFFIFLYSGPAAISRDSTTSKHTFK